MGLFKALITIILCIVVFVLAVWVFDQVRYSLTVKQELNNQDATCYFDRGVFNLPIVKICTYNNTLLVEKDEKILLPRYGKNISIFPNGSWVKNG